MKNFALGVSIALNVGMLALLSAAKTVLVEKDRAAAKAKGDAEWDATLDSIVRRFENNDKDEED